MLYNGGETFQEAKLWAVDRMSAALPKGWIGGRYYYRWFKPLPKRKKKEKEVEPDKDLKLINRNIFLRVL